jgi:hypothetical protein
MSWPSKLLPAVALLVVAIGAVRDPAPSAPRFVDVREGSGVEFTHISGALDEKEYIFEAKGGGIAAFDYNNDGLMDLLLVQGSTLDRIRAGRTARCSLFENKGGWKFQDVTERAGLSYRGWGMGVGIADYDNDGRADVYITALGPNVLFHNNGDGTFTNVTAAAGVGDTRWSASAAFGDYDNDGLLDLYVANYLDAGPANLPDRSGRHCEYRGRPVLCGPRGLPGAADVLYRNLGGGKFADVSHQTGAEDKDSFFGLGVIFADLDNDHDLDIYVANDATPNLLFVNSGKGTFEEKGFLSGLALSGEGREQASMGVDAADYDNDGLLDVYCTHFAADYSTLYHNDGGLFFTDVTEPARIRDPEWTLVSWGFRFVDVNNDGWKDILHVNGHVYPYLDREKNPPETYRQPKTLYLNQGDGTFDDASAQAGPDFSRKTCSRGAAFGDFDNDGDIDVAVTNMNGAPELLRNEQTVANHWVMFRTVGSHSNRDGIGARIVVSVGGAQQVWEIRRTVGIYSCSDPRAHFGLGSASRIDRVSVSWPSGKTQEFTDVAADKHYALHEDRGLLVDDYSVW